MKLRNVLTVLGTAAITAALTLALLAPWGGGAQAGPAVQPVIPQAQLASQGCTFTLKTDKTAYEAGEAPVIEVQAVNPTDKTASASVWVRVTTSSPISPRSRMLAIPLPLWSHEYAFILAPGETKSLNTACAALPAGQNVTILLTDQKDAVMAGNLGIPAPGAPTGPNGQQPIAAPTQPPQQ